MVARLIYGGVAAIVSITYLTGNIGFEDAVVWMLLVCATALADIAGSKS